MRHRLRTPLTGMFALASLVLPLAAGCGGGGAGPGLDPERNADATDVTLRIAANAVAGGKNATGAQWVNEYVIPGFTAKMKAKGVNVKVTFEGAGVEDEQYKTKRALDLKTRSGADLMNLDGIWTGEFAQAGYLLPLEQVVGSKVNSWEGWSQIPGPVQTNAAFNGKRYGLPWGTDGRVIFYNKELFAKAGLPATWQPKSWEEILTAARALKKISGVTPIQLNAGTAMGEATTMQGVLPMLAGTGRDVYASGKWMGTSAQLDEVLGLYKTIFDEGLGDKEVQLQAKGRDKSFADFAEDKVGILLEGDYFWRSVINPDEGIAPMEDRDATVGYALIPAARPGSGVRGQDFVSYSGGATWMINPNTKYPQQAWELLQFMGSAEAVKKANELTSIGITQRKDVNDQVLGDDPLMKLISEQVLPITSTRPPLAAYTEVSVALQQATADIVSGKSPQEAAQTYKASVERAAGGAANVSTG